MKTTLSTSLTALLTPSADLATGEFNVQLARVNTVLLDGSGLAQANRVFADTGSLTASSTLTLDLYDFGGALDALGQTYALSKIKAIHIRNKATDAGATLRVGAEGTTAAWMSVNGEDDVRIADVPAGGELILLAPTAAGFAVADVTNHLLKLANQSGSAALAYDIVIIGAQ